MPRLSLTPTPPLPLPFGDEAGLQAAIAGIRAPDSHAAAAARRRLDNLTKPLGSLGRIEELAERLAAIASPAPLAASPKCIVVMCADNGVCTEGVSSCPVEVTATVTANFTRGITGVNVLADLAGSALRVIDIGVNQPVTVPGVHQQAVRRGTGNIARSAAMSRAEAIQALAVGVASVAALAAEGFRVIGTGEMGIGNTTTSAALAAAYTGLLPAAVTGRGAGLSDEALARKVATVEQALARHRPDPSDPLGTLAALGGLDIAGLAGCCIGGAIHRLPVVIDGFIAQAAALAAIRICPACAPFLIAAHGSAEPGSQALLKAVGQKPLLDLGLRLGEGTGAALAFHLLDAAAAVYERMGSFGDAAIEAYQPQSS